MSKHLGPGAGPSHVDPSLIRPRRGVLAGVWVAAGLLLLGAVAGFVLTLVSAVDAIDRDQAFRSGGSARVEVTADGEPAVYGQAPVPEGADCTLDGPGEAKFSPYGARYTVKLNRTTWVRLLRIEADTPGTYTLRCTDPAGSATFAPGDGAGLGALANTLLLRSALPGLAGLALAGVAVALVVRRSRHRNRLAAEALGRSGPPPHGDGPSYGPGGPAGLQHDPWRSPPGAPRKE
ncbi:hypothetical protein OHB02_18695 [Streptomyces albidoflavus]|uniref:hypothetical protein n=1 Tax=Streptomyces TaxID=1883 RepID=UPI001E5C485C|nr:hypothetical protein [Streptomyces sp. OUCMDZ-3434]WSB22103.1 hypothetical protein OHB02_18695 [Streptomyces albidoflavus]